MVMWRRMLAAATLAAVLMGCQGPSGDQTRKLIGAVILNDPGVERSETGCTGSGQYADITDGLEVTIRDEAGEEIGSSGLAFDPRGTADQCLFTWELMIGDAESYSINVGERDAGTYTREDMNTRSWQVAVTFGD